MLNNRIGFLAGLGFMQQPAAEVTQTLADLGYDAVEWTLNHFHPRAHTAAQRRETVEAARNAGLAISGVVMEQDYVCLDEAVRNDRIALTIEAIEACAEAGIPGVNLFTGPAPWDPNAPKIPSDISEWMAWQIVLEAFGIIAAALEKNQIHGCVENVWGHLCNDYYTLRPLIDQMNSPWLGVNFDPSHDVLKGNFDTGWIVRQWGKERIHHVHLKDAIGVQVEGQFLFPMLGEGRVDWPGMFGALDEIGYEGYCSIEFESFTYYANVLKGNAGEAARRALADLQALLHND